MITIILLISVSLLTCSSASLIQPYDLVAEAEKQLEELITLIEYRIWLADDDIQDLWNACRDRSRDEIFYSHEDIKSHYETTHAQITQIKLLAQSAGKDISSCTNIREDALQQEADKYRNQITDCVEINVAEGQKATQDAKYYIHIIMNKVRNLENQFKSCGNDFLCISPLLIQIELYKINLIQEIRNEIRAVDEILLKLEASSRTCAANGLSAYVAQSSVILSEITTCANAILG